MAAKSHGKASLVSDQPYGTLTTAQMQFVRTATPVRKLTHASPKNTKGAPNLSPQRQENRTVL